MNIGKAIKVALAKKEMRLKHLATSLGVSSAYLSAITNNQKQPTFRVLISISLVLGMKLSELIALGEDETAA